MPTQETVDFEAIAKRYGGVAAKPKPASNVLDFASLAKKYGGVASAPAKQPLVATGKVSLDHADLAKKYGGVPAEKTQQTPEQKLYNTTLSEGQTPERAQQ